MAKNSSVVNVSGQPLRYIVTKNLNSIRFLQNSGSLIGFEPIDSSRINIPEDDETLNDKYREIWVSSYFLAGGYGALNREEQSYLHTLAGNKDDILSSITKANYAYIKVDDLEKTKVTQGTIDTPLTENSEYDISYNIFDFGGESIYLMDLYTKLANRKLLNTLEINKIQYSVKLSNGKYYPGNSVEEQLTSSLSIDVPVNYRVERVHIVLYGNTKDSGGLNSISFDFCGNDGTYNPIENQDESDTQLNIFNISVSEIETIQTLMASQKNIELHIIYNPAEGIDHITQFGPQALINNIQLFILGSDESQEAINKIDSETRILDDALYGLQLNGVRTFNYICLSDAPEEEDNSTIDISELNQYTQEYILAHPIYDECGIGKIKITGDDKINYVSTLVYMDNVSLINCEFVDYMSHNIYNITNFCKMDVIIVSDNDSKYVKYSLNIGTNSEFDTNINPAFIHKDSETEKYIFNKGEIVMTFSINTPITEEDTKMLNDTYIGDYWISGDYFELE